MLPDSKSREGNAFEWLFSRKRPDITVTYSGAQVAAGAVPPSMLYGHFPTTCNTQSGGNMPIRVAFLNRLHASNERLVINDGPGRVTAQNPLESVAQKNISKVVQGLTSANSSNFMNMVNNYEDSVSNYAGLFARLWGLFYHLQSAQVHVPPVADFAHCQVSIDNIDNHTLHGASTVWLYDSGTIIKTPMIMSCLYTAVQPNFAVAHELEQ